MTAHQCHTCAEYQAEPTEIAGRPFTAELCRRMQMVTALARMAWVGRYGLPSAEPHCGPEAKNWVAA